MSKPSPRHATPSQARRGLASVGVLSLALAGGAFAMAGAGTASAASATGEYNCKVSDLGLAFKTPWQVTLSADLPSTVQPGAAIPAPTINAHIVTGSDSADLLRNQVIVSGTSDATYTVGGQPRTASLTVTGLPYTVPATGGITTDATGSGQAETAPSTPTTIPVVAGDFTAKLTMKSGFVANLSCTPANGTGIELGSIKVAAAPTSTTSTTTSTTAPTTPTTTSSTTSTTSQPTTPTSTTSTTTSTSPTSTSTSTSPSPTSTTSTSSTTSSATSTSTTTDPSTTTDTSTPTSTETGTPTDTGTATATDTSTATETGTPTDTGTATDTSTATATGTPTAPGDTGSSSATVAPTAPAGTNTPGGPGPKVDTDYVNPSTANMAGIALAAAGFVALGGAVVAGRRND